MPVETRHKGTTTTSSSSGKAHMVPPPQPEPGLTKEQMMAPPPIRIPALTNEQLAGGAQFLNIIHFAGLRATDLTKDVKGQTKEILDTLDQLLEQNMTDKSKILNCHIKLKDKASFQPL